MAADDYLINFRVTGDGTAKAAAESVGQSLGGISDAAGKSGGGMATFSTGLGGVVTRLGLAGAALKLVSVGLEEVAEDDKATEALRKAGLSAEEAAKQMQALEDIELFTGDKVSAARLLGDVMNGRTRELKGYGIELSATASMEEKLAAIQTLRARGQQVDAARVGTLTGEYQRFTHGLSNAIGAAASWTVQNTGVAKVLGWVNQNVLGLNASIDAQPPKVRVAAVAFKAYANEVENSNARLKAGMALLDSFSKGLGTGTDTDSRIFEANLERDIADGKVTEPQAQRQRAQRKADEAEKARLNKATDAERTKEQAKNERERIERELNDEALRKQAESDADKAGILDPEKRREFSENQIRKQQEERGKALREIAEAESRAARELQQRKDERDAAVAELEAEMAKADRAESEEEMRKGQQREDEAARNSAEKIKQLEDKAREEKESRERARELGDKLAEAEEKARKEAEEIAEKDRKGKFDERGRPLDRRGRRKITAPASPNELEPLPDRRVSDAAGKAATDTKAATDSAVKSVKAMGEGQSQFAASVNAFAGETSAALAQMRRDLEQLRQQLRSHI